MNTSSQSAALWEELSPPASEALELAGNDDYLIGASLDWCDWTDTEVELTPVESASVTRVEDCFETSGRKHKLDVELHPEHSTKRAKRVHDIQSVLTEGTNVDADDLLFEEFDIPHDIAEVEIPPQEPPSPSTALDSTSNHRGAPNLPTSPKTARDSIPLPLPPRKDGNHVLIGFDRGLQALMIEHQLAWGTQYEIIRFYIKSAEYRFTLDEYRTIMPQLRGSNAHASEVRPCLKLLWHAQRHPTNNAPGGGHHVHPTTSSMLERIKEFAAAAERNHQDPWSELDQEERHLEDGVGAGHGLLEPDPMWYGGQVLFTFKLIELGKGSYAFRLEQPRLGKSNRFSRQLGSRRVLSVSLPDRIASSSHLTQFFNSRFVFLGRIFQAVFAREGSCYLIETGDYVATPPLPPDHLTTNDRLEFLTFLQWHNPLSYNKGQSVAKYFARFALGLSTSLPAFRVKPGNIRVMEDIVSPAFDIGSGGKPPSHQLMTDGCGFANAAALLLVQKRLKLASKPLAIQGRIGGAKGMFVLHPTFQADEPEPIVWCRHSQVKIKYGPEGFVSPDPAHCTFDLLRASQLKRPAHLSKEVMQCLMHGGVDLKTLLRIFRAQLDAELESVSNMDRQFAMLKVFDYVARVENVYQARIRREAGGLSRALGYGVDSDGSDGFFDADDGIGEQSTPWAPDLVSGLPSSLAETIMAFLAAGFHPHENNVLFAKLKAVVKMAIEKAVFRYKICLPLSVEGFAIPDPFGVLDEGEIFCRGSTPWADNQGTCCDVIIGDVLATRHPCKVASDVRKFRAVDKPMLHAYVDVIVFSTKGLRSALSWLGGGDYDGDTVIVLWDPELVRQFTNVQECRGDPPDDFIEANFHKEIRKVDEYASSLAHMGPTEKEDEAKKYLLAGLGGVTLVGQYSNYHEKAAYTLGYNNDETVRLAHMFCTVLDGSKSGLVVKASVKANDHGRWGHLVFDQRGESFQGYTMYDQKPRVPAQRPRNLGPDIIDKFHSIGKDFLHKLDKLERCGPLAKHSTLATPYEELDHRILQLEKCDASGCSKRAQLNLIIAAVNNAKNRHLQRMKDEVAKRKHLARPFSDGRLSFTSLPIVERQDILRSLSAEYAADLHAVFEKCTLFDSMGSVRRIAASYAYYSTYSNARESRFPYDVAFRDLAAIKAEATGTSSTIVREFAERFVLHRASLKLL